MAALVAPSAPGEGDVQHPVTNAMQNPPNNTMNKP
jgi:hypothetical protein